MIGNELFVHQEKKDYTVPVARVTLKVGEAMSDVKVKDAADPRTPGVPPSAITGIIKEESSLADKSIVCTIHSFFAHFSRSSRIMKLSIRTSFTIAFLTTMIMWIRR